MAKKKRRKTSRKKKTTGRKKTTTRRKTTRGKKRKTTTKRKKKTTARRRKTTTRKKKTTGKKRKPNAQFMSPMKPSDALAAVIGARALPRTQVVKKVWQYIKRRKLQDPKNKRNIRADAKLLKVFKGKKVVNMFEMTKLLNKQLKKAA